MHFEKIYIAPEAPDQPSRGRKPSPQFLFDARDEFGLNLAESFMVGDKLIDLECGWNAGVQKSILVRTGYGAEVERDDAEQIKRAVVVDDLAGVAEWILKKSIRNLKFAINLCAASSDTSAKKRPRPSCLKGCGGWNIAATTAPAWRFWTTPDCSLRKKKGKIDEGLARVLKAEPAAGNLGIGHTRWATHGVPSDKNSHPHLDASGKIAVVHNGVIENYDTLKQRLIQGRAQIQIRHRHRSPRAFDRRTTTPNERGKNGDALTQAVCDALREVIGTYGLAVICTDLPDTIVGARRGSPLIIGIGKDENFLASDANAIVAHTKKVVYLNDYDVATITPERFDVSNLGTDTANVQISNLEFSQEDAERGKHAHFMLKEIYEQPQTV